MGITFSPGIKLDYDNVIEFTVNPNSQFFSFIGDSSFDKSNQLTIPINSVIIESVTNSDIIVSLGFDPLLHTTYDRPDGPNYVVVITYTFNGEISYLLRKKESELLVTPEQQFYGNFYKVSTSKFRIEEVDFVGKDARTNELCLDYISKQGVSVKHLDGLVNLINSTIHEKVFLFESSNSFVIFGGEEFISKHKQKKEAMVNFIIPKSTLTVFTR